MLLISLYNLAKLTFSLFSSHIMLLSYLTCLSVTEFLPHFLLCFILCLFSCVLYKYYLLQETVLGSLNCQYPPPSQTTLHFIYFVIWGVFILFIFIPYTFILVFLSVSFWWKGIVSVVTFVSQHPAQYLAPRRYSLNKCLVIHWLIDLDLWS